MSKVTRLVLGWSAAVAALAVSSVALGLPWDIDMADAQTQKAYEARMLPLPDGVVAQDNLLTPKGFQTNALRGSPESKKLLAPVSNAERVKLGNQMYDAYCYPCHGSDGVELGPVAMRDSAPDRFPGVVPLAGPGGVAKSRDDHWIYLTIRNGGANMPAYGHTMSDEEMWSIVHYIRTFDNAQYVDPNAPTEGASDGEDAP